jgi:hypothetical protein
VRFGIRSWVPWVRSAVVACITYVVCAAPLASRAQQPAATPARPVAGDVELVSTTALVEDVMMLADGVVPKTADPQAIAQRIRSGALSWNAFIDEELARPEFSRTVANEVLFPNRLPKHIVRHVPVLKTFESARGPIYYKDTRCEPNEAVDVTPWWDFDAKVHVCPQAYRPDVRGDGKGLYCSGKRLLLTEFCGCGPNLMRCFRDKKHVMEVQKSIANELESTVGYVVANDRPLAELFTMQATVRDATAELLYQRDRVERGELRELTRPELPRDGVPAPRFNTKSGQHAGLLTASELAYEGDVRRQRMARTFNWLWCLDPGSITVYPERIRPLLTKATNLRYEGEGWKGLAEQPFCEGCHARLDYGWQFFFETPDVWTARHFVADLEPKSSRDVGTLYMSSTRDPRGTGPRTPLSFGKLTTAQPEFAQCMATRAMQYVFADQYSEDLNTQLLSAYRTTPTLRTLLRVALRAYVAQRLQPPPGVSRDSGARTVASPSTPAQVSPRTKALLDKNCDTGCHDDGVAKEIFEDTSSLSRDELVTMLGLVSAEMMPWQTKLDSRTRSELLASLAADVWTDPGERGRAVEYLDHLMRTPPLHSIATTLRTMESRVGGSANKPMLLSKLAERQVGLPNQVELSPSAAASLYLYANNVCEEQLAKQGRSKTGASDEIARCIDAAIGPSILFR